MSAMFRSLRMPCHCILPGMRRIFLSVVAIVLGWASGLAAQSKPAAQPEVAAIYFPGYHRDTHYDAWFGEGWNEWKLLAEAPTRFPGQHFFRPEWGAFDEADPKWMERQVALAADHGVSV